LKKIIAIALSLGVILSLTSCNTPIDRAENQSGKEKVEASQGAVSESEPDEIEQKNLSIKKYNTYVSAADVIGNRFVTVCNDYLDEFGDGEEMIIEKNFSYSPIAFSEYAIDDMTKAFEMSKEEPKFEGIDERYQALYPEFMILAEDFSQSKLYYESKGYIDDDFAKGKELHKKLISQIDKVTALAEPFSDSFNEESNKRRLEDMLLYKEQEQMIKYSAINLIIKTENLLTAINEQEIWGGNITELDLDTYMPPYNELVEAFDEFNKYISDQEQVTKENIPTKSAYFRSFSDDAIEIKASAAEIIERVQQGKAVDSFSTRSYFFLSGEKGTPEKINKSLSSFINDYNNLIN